MTDLPKTDKKRAATTIRAQLLEESSAMARYALSSGLKVPGPVAETLDAFGAPDGAAAGPTVKQLARAHATLARLVAPATPRSIMITETTGTGSGRALGEVRLLRWLMVVTGICLVVFLATSWNLGNPVTGQAAAPIAGWESVLHQLRYLAAAGLGASFYALFKAHRYVAERTFDPSFESAYWVRFALGLIAGTILANFIQIDLSQAGSSACGWRRGSSRCSMN